VKIRLLLPSSTVEAALGIPFSWSPIHRPGGTAICVMIGVVLVNEIRRRHTLFILTLGAASHLLADLLLTKASGRAFPILWPLTRWQPPTPGLSLDTHPEPTIVAAGLAIIAWAMTRWQRRSTE
jgi:membrane-bound metal-dependent hydrolase YbcI (DUF457 family)